jgi:hypothetical protein
MASGLGIAKSHEFVYLTLQSVPLGTLFFPVPL